MDTDRISKGIVVEALHDQRLNRHILWAVGTDALISPNIIAYLGNGHYIHLVSCPNVKT